MKCRPLGDRVIIEPDEAADITKGGIVLPDGAKEKPMEGTIMAVGPGSMLPSGERRPMTVKEGDEVIYAKYAGTEIKVDGKKLLIL